MKEAPVHGFPLEESHRPRVRVREDALRAVLRIANRIQLLGDRREPDEPAPRAPLGDVDQLLLGHLEDGLRVGGVDGRTRGAARLQERNGLSA